MLRRKLPKRQQGLLLIEMMVGMVIGLLIVAAAGTTYIISSRSGRDNINSTRLNVELRGAMDVMADEIRRAGATGELANAGVGNRFTDQAVATRTDLQVSADGTCVELAYDADGDGIVDTEDYAGFRIQSGRVQARRGGSGVVNNCQNGYWESLTDIRTVIIQPFAIGMPYFAVSYQCLNTLNNQSQDVSCNDYDYTGIAAGTTADMLETRIVTINLGGRLAQDEAMLIRLSQRVLVRNHRVVTGVAPT